MVTRTRLSVRLYVNYLSCLLIALTKEENVGNQLFGFVTSCTRELVNYILNDSYLDNGENTA